MIHKSMDNLIYREEILKSAKEASFTSRISSLRITSKAKASHIGSCLSVIDILSLLFAIKKTNILAKDDIVILSKGHAAAALYAVLDFYELLQADLVSYCENDSPIYGHINHHASNSIPLSTGSLGHGLPFALGIALANKLKQSSNKTYVVISDGELNEGTTWESLMIASHHELKNLTLIIDKNSIQSLGFTEDILCTEPLAEKIRSFNWNCYEIDGHNQEELLSAIALESDRPKCIIANTIKGKGVSFMENTLTWHYRSADSDELQMAIDQVTESYENA